MMSSKEATPPKVFISYSHDSSEHDERVLALADRLNQDGIDCMLDQYVDSPREGWPRWMDGQMREVDFVLVICSATYNRRAMGKEEPGKGLGLRWESTLAYQYLYNAGTVNERFIPVLLEGASITDIPTPLQGATHYRLPQDYDVLYRRLTGQHPTPKPPVGAVRALPPHERQPRSFETAPQEHTPDSITRLPGQISTPAAEGKQVLLWNIPYERNPLFTGREDTLNRLDTALRSGKTTALSQPQAISSLGGIGKTQTAVEYAYRHKDDYDAVLWVKAESRETLISDFVTLARLLNLPEQQEQEQRLVIEAVKRWFHDHPRWLLIFDNADDLTMVREFLPTGGTGHVLLTTRSQVTGRIGQRIEVERMEPEEGVLFLLHRANILDLDAPLEAASSSDRDQAREIVQAMDGLPLALDQAGAYIDETRCGLSGYLKLYRLRQADLLKQRGKLVADHPDAVGTTWSLSFEKVQQANPAAADLLRLCAFLDPDAILEEIITKGAPHLGSTLQPVAADPIKLNEAIRELLTYSLIQRNPDQTLTVHRLVQAVLKHGMNKITQRRWAERAVRAVSAAFPEVEYGNWLRCQQYMPHVQMCKALIEEWNMTFREATDLLMQAASYLRDSAQYEQAESLVQQTLAIDEQVLGLEHPKLATDLNNLAYLYTEQGKFEQAEPLYLRAIAIGEQVLGPEHPNLATRLNNLALLYTEQGNFEQAEPLYLRAIAIGEKMLGSEHPNLATRLNNLANLYTEQGKFEQAEPLSLRAIAIDEQVLGPEHPKLATDLSNLANLYTEQGKFEQAEPLYLRAIAIGEQVLGPEHPNLATWLNNLALLYWKQGEFEQAEPLLQRALAIHERVFGPTHPFTMPVRKSYTALLEEMKQKKSRGQGRHEV